MRLGGDDIGEEQAPPYQTRQRKAAASLSHFLPSGDPALSWLSISSFPACDWSGCALPTKPRQAWEEEGALKPVAGE
jgi:hypothetical protein